ncbi:hypothetical protein AVEN_101801-1 [Araneus ventricosus]|uniref:Uncharacterized protein n=1 Tax=Araneus ventricosus TaxID=182803 RepID=A0A4Y2D2H4_ARAVE|nr:hypothetical protein AVEN_101801-1 [Araneus ventricosus]
MKPFDCKYGRKQEIFDEKEENVILMEESEDEVFGSFQQEMEVAKMVEVIYLESSMLDFSTNLFVLIYNLGGNRINTHYAYLCWFQKLYSGEFDITVLRTTNLAK